MGTSMVQIPLHMVSWVHLSHLTQGIQRSSIETRLGWTFPTAEFQIFPSKQKLFVFFASIHYWNQGLNESVKLWTWILLPSLTLQIRQCCWKSVPCPACTKKTYNSNKEGEKAPGQGPWEPAVSPSVQPRYITANATVSSLPKTHLPISASVVATDTHLPREKTKSLLCLASLPY